MPEADCSIALVIPGLCGPAGDVPLDGYLGERPVALERLLSRARVEAHTPSDTDATVCALFNHVPDAGSSWPVAPLTWLADSGRQSAGFVLRADPVHLRADQACLRLFDSTSFSIEPDEAQALVAAFNDYYRDRGWRLEAPLPQRWYLSMPAAPDISTVPPLKMAGRDINTGLPCGGDRLQWHAVLNEVQMLFHTHPVNAARESRGEPAINSIWPWGGGYLPPVTATSVRQVIADRPVSLGLARLHGIARHAVPENAPDLAQLLVRGLNLLVLDSLEAPARYGEADAWASVVRQMERAWFRPLLAWLASGRITSLNLYPVNGKRFALPRRRLKYYWKRTRSLEGCCHHAPTHRSTLTSH